MIPILYEATETSFTNNGLGALAQAISCRVIEERNGQYELVMEYPQTGVLFKELTHSRIISAKPSDRSDRQPFRIYKISKPMNGRVRVNARHISYDLSDCVVMPFTSTAVTAENAMKAMKEHAAQGCAFSFWSDKEPTSDYTVEVPTSLRALLGGVEGSILDVYGTGEYEWDNFDVKFHLHRGNDNGVQLRYGKNITDIMQEENIAKVVTGIVPFWSQSGTTVTLSEKVLQIANAANYPVPKTVPVDFTDKFSEAPTEAELRTKAQAYVDANLSGIPEINIKVSFAQLWQYAGYEWLKALERVSLCDTVTVIFEKLGIEATAEVIRTEYDVLLERYDSIEVGDLKTSLADAVNRIDNEIRTVTKTLKDGSIVKEAVDKATTQITGEFANLGHVQFTYDGDGGITEILIMDTDNRNTATKVWRWNLGGFGFSSNGYAGPYTTAITMDGQIVADMITTGTLSAIDIEGVNISGSSLVFGDTTKTTLSDNAAETGALFSGDGVMQFETNGEFYAKNKFGSGDIANSLRMSYTNGRIYNAVGNRDRNGNEVNYLSMDVYDDGTDDRNSVSLANKKYTDPTLNGNRLALVSRNSIESFSLYNYAINQNNYGNGFYAYSQVADDNVTNAYTISNNKVAEGSGDQFASNLFMAATATSNGANLNNYQLENNVLANSYQLSALAGSHTMSLVNQEIGASPSVGNQITLKSSSTNEINITNNLKGTGSPCNKIYLKQASGINAFDFYNYLNASNLGNHLAMFAIPASNWNACRFDNYHANGNIGNKLYMESSGNSGSISLVNNDANGNAKTSLVFETSGRALLKTNTGGTSWLEMASSGNVTLQANNSLNIGSQTYNVYLYGKALYWNGAQKW